MSDILEFNRSMREQRIKGYVVILLGVGLLAVGIEIVAFQQGQPEPAPVFIFGGAFILLGVFVTRLAGIGAWFLKSQRTLFEIEIRPDGVAFLEGSQTDLIGWENFSRWYETRNLLVLMTRGDGLAIPKRSCGEAEWHALQALVREKLGAPARW
jgi:hypothetical protein